MTILQKSIKLKLSLLLAVDWINNHLDDFSLDNIPNDNDLHPNFDAGRIKPLSELALTLLVLDKCGISIPIMNYLKKWVWENSHQGTYLVKILLARNDYLPCCAFYSAMYQMGFESDTLNKVLLMLAGMDMRLSLPLQPWGRLAMDYNLSKLGILNSGEVRVTDLYLNNSPEPWAVSGEVAYAITHEVFYLTDFGFSELSNKGQIEYLRLWVPYWSNKFFQQENFDLVGEFSMVWSCISKKKLFLQNPVYKILKYQRLDGSFNGPKGAGSFLFTKKDSEERRYFLQNYHTTLVLIMAISMSLRNLALEY